MNSPEDMGGRSWREEAWPSWGGAWGLRPVWGGGGRRSAAWCFDGLEITIVIRLLILIPGSVSGAPAACPPLVGPLCSLGGMNAQHPLTDQPVLLANPFDRGKN